jgi:UPF0716 family protein affecting phage T7 exclusion
MTPLIAFALGVLLALAVMLAAVAIGAHIARTRALRAGARRNVPSQYRGHVPPGPLTPRHVA